MSSEKSKSKHFNFGKEGPNNFNTNLKELISGIKDPTELFFHNLNEHEMRKIKEEVDYYIQDEKYINSVDYFKKKNLRDRLEDEDKLKIKVSDNNMNLIEIEELNMAKTKRSKEYVSNKDYNSMIQHFKDKLMRENVKSIISKQKKWKKKELKSYLNRQDEKEDGNLIKQLKLKSIEKPSDFVKVTKSTLKDIVKKRNVETSLRTVRLQKKKYNVHKIDKKS